MENKELYKMVSEISERTARTETKVDALAENGKEDGKKVEYIKDIAIEAKNEADRANNRMDSADKWRFSIGSASVIAIVTSILNLILK